MKLENLKEENVMLKFHAKWCGPCKILKTLTDNLDKEGVFNEYGYKLIEVDVDDFSDLAEEYNVRSLPTVFFMKKGIPE